MVLFGTNENKLVWKFSSSGMMLVRSDSEKYRKLELKERKCRHVVGIRIFPHFEIHFHRNLRKIQDKSKLSELLPSKEEIK